MALAEQYDNVVADFEALDVGTDGNDCSGTIRAWDYVLFDGEGITALSDLVLL